MPVLAAGWEDVDVEVSEIEVEGDPYVGKWITASGTVTIISESSALGFPAYAYAESDAGYRIADPNDETVDEGGGAYQYNDDYGLIWATAEAGQTYEWESRFVLDEKGDYIVAQGGEAYAGWETGLWFWSNSGLTIDTGHLSATIMAVRNPTLFTVMMQLAQIPADMPVEQITHWHMA